MNPDENLKYYGLKETAYYKIHGRTDETQDPLPLFFNGSGIEVNVTGSELWIDIDVDFGLHEPWIYTELNGSFMSRQMLTAGRYSLCLFRSMSREAVKNVRFFRELQAMSEDDACSILIRGFRLDGDFVPVADRRFKLEFIGDSITSGEGTYGAEADTDWLAMYMSVSRNYAKMVSDALDAEFRLISQGGWGVLSGWDNDPRHTIPSCYEKVCGLATGKTNERLGAWKPYDFGSWVPDAIIVNLGTSDAGAFHQPEWRNPETGETFQQHKEADGSFREEDIARFKKAVTDFLFMIRRNNPSSHIVWTYGMLVYDLTFAITDAMNTYRKCQGMKMLPFYSFPIRRQRRSALMDIRANAHMSRRRKCSRNICGKNWRSEWKMDRSASRSFRICSFVRRMNFTRIYCNVILFRQVI